MGVLVAVTAAGGGVAQSIIKALYETSYETLAIDPSDRAAGLYLADRGAIGLPVSDDNFVGKIIDICKAEGAKYIFSGFDAELEVLSRCADQIRAEGITPIVSTPDVITLSEDKYQLIKFLEKKGLPFIPTYDHETGETCGKLPAVGPYIVKPRTGCRSQHVQICGSREVASSYTVPGESVLTQEYIEGDEYTCGTVSFDGHVHGVICMVRELRSGDTYKAVVDQNPMVLDFVSELVREIRPFGPCNIQLRVRDNVPYVLEINARCSGTTAARQVAGFNEPEIVLDHLEGRPSYDNAIEDGLQILRYWQELAVRPVDKKRIKR